MINFYCHRQHGGQQMCADCRELLDYAYQRLERCKFGERKPVCGNCPIHCYRPEMRQKIVEVMRFSGPRMLFRHPILMLSHLLDARRSAPKLKN